jgi:hypothetical protein
MPGLTAELQRMASDAARQADRLAAAEVIREGDRRRRRSVALRSLAVLSVAGVAAGVTLALGLTGVHGSVPAHRTFAIRTAAFTLTGNANGTDTLTINQLVLVEPSTLQKDLTLYGIPAIVSTGRFCSSNPGPAGFSKVVSLSMHGSLPNQTMTIDPSALPAGTKLSFGSFQLPTETAVTLIDKNSYSCTSAAPSFPPARRTGPARTFTGVLFLYSSPVNP